MATANKDGAASTPSLRTLGSGPQQAMPGNANPSPGGAAGGALAGTYPSPTLAAPEPWTEFTPGTGCAPGQFCQAGLADYPDANTVAFFKDPFGIIHLKGTVLNSGTAPAFDLFFVPEGYRPAGAGAYAVAKGNNVSIVDVLPNGAVDITSGLAQGEAVSLDGLTWRAG